MLEFESLLIFSLLDSLEKGIFNERISLQHETFLPLQRWVENVNFCKLIFANFNFSVTQKGETLHKSHFLDSFCASTVMVMTEKERDESGRSQLSRNRKDIKVKHQRNEFACSSHPPTLTECSPSPFASPLDRTHIRHEKREGETVERKMGMKWEKNYAISSWLAFVAVRQSWNKSSVEFILTLGLVARSVAGFFVLSLSLSSSPNVPPLFTRYQTAELPSTKFYFFPSSNVTSLTSTEGTFKFARERRVK